MRGQVRKRESQQGRGVMEFTVIEEMAREYVRLREIKKEIEERMRELEEGLRKWTEQFGNVVVDGYEVGFFSRREGEVVDLKRFIEVAIEKRVEQFVLKPVITQVRVLKIKELLELLIEKERRIFSVKKLG